MPRPRNEEARVLGPSLVEIRGVQYWRIIVVTPDAPDPKKRKLARYYRSENDANEDAQAAREQIVKTRTVALEDAITGYEQHLKDKGTIGYEETVRRLRAFFPDLAMFLSRVTPERAGEYYDAFRQRERHDGKPISASYHRAALINARSFVRWCIKQGWLRDNPFDKVEGIGKRKKGKRKPTGNELQKWFDYVMGRAEKGHDAAIAVMLQFALALRSSDLTRRLVRDVDLNATQLIVEDGKTEESNEPRIIPDDLQPMLRAFVAGRDVMEPLFKTTRTESGHHDDHWIWQAQERFCRLAKVPHFCPHALKGVSGTILAKRGAAGNAVMDHLSHRKDTTTFGHYVDRKVVEATQAGQAFKLIAGGRR